jgi:hypothetical protein
MVERFDENVVAAQIENLRPEVFIRQPGADNQTWGRDQCGGAFQQILPAPVRLVALAEHNGHFVVVQQTQGLLAAVALVPSPVDVAKDSRQQEVISGVRTGQQDRCWLVR